MQAKQCPQCGIQIKVGRTDKRFCSDDCRSQYHNNFNKGRSSYVRRVNRMLGKNRQILHRLAPNGKSKIRRAELLSHGFHFDWHTHIYETRSKKKYYFCYEYGWLEIENDFIIIVRRED
jgi:predicted nucleic acid-binding Zn ribbon protein